MIQRPAPALATAIPANAMVIAVNRITIATRRMVRQARGYTSPREPRGVAQLVEHRSPKPGVAGSSPVAPVLVLVAALLAAGCGQSHATKRLGTGITFVPAPPKVIAACHVTARIVGYAVPCPMKVPRRTTETGAVGPTGCALHVIGPAVCAKSWRGWVVGSSYVGNHHLVLTASPTPI